MHRRTFLELAGLGTLALACGSGRNDGVSSPAAPSPASPGSFPLLAQVPGFCDCGPWTGDGPGPVLVQLTLNINDFMRPDLEAASVRRWMALARKHGGWPLELSFTGHVLQAFVDHEPGLIDEILASRPTIRQHYRLLKDRKLISTERELYATDPATLELDRSHYGPAVLIQKTFGVTTREEGGVVSELLRRAWTTGEDSKALEALGYDKLQRNDQIGHPNRIVAWSLPDVAPQDAYEHIEVFLRIRRLEQALLAGKELDPARLEDSLTDMLRWSQIATEMGFDVSAIEGLSDFVPVGNLPTFGIGIFGMSPRDQYLSAFQAALARDPAALKARMEAMMLALAQRTSSLPDIASELSFKMSRLSPDRVWATRLAWHASNDHTLEAWGINMYGKREDGQRPSRPFPLTPDGERPQAQQDAIQAAAASILQTVASNERCRVVSMHNDTQWAAENSPEAGYPQVFGVAFAGVPDNLDADAIDAQARAAGVEPPEARGAGQRGKAGKAGKGSSGGRGGQGGRGRGGGQGGGGQGGGGQGGGGQGGERFRRRADGGEGGEGGEGGGARFRQRGGQDGAQQRGAGGDQEGARRRGKAEGSDQQPMRRRQGRGAPATQDTEE